MEPIAKKMRCAHKPISWPLLQATPLGVHLCDVAGQVVVDAVDKEGAAALWGGLDRCNFISKFSGGASPFLTASDWDHNCRTSRRNFERHDIIYGKQAGDGSLVTASFAYIELVRDAAGPRGGF